MRTNGIPAPFVASGQPSLLRAARSYAGERGPGDGSPSCRPSIMVKLSVSLVLCEVLDRVVIHDTCW